MQNLSRIPKKITPDPIIDSVLEIRFKSNKSDEEALNILYENVKDDFKKIKFRVVPLVPTTKNVLTQLTLKNNDYIINLGPEVISIGCEGIYKGWGNLSSAFSSLLKKILKIDFIVSIERLGLRYINFFSISNKISELLDLTFLFTESEKYSEEAFFLRTQVVKDNVKAHIQIANNSKIDGIPDSGIILDLDVVYLLKIENLFQSILNIFNELHEEEKRLFYSFLKDDYINSHNPEYEGNHNE